MNTNLFPQFDPELIKSVKDSYQNELDGAFRARAESAKSRIETRAAESDVILEKLMPEKFEPGTSWHIMSGGDIDALTFLRMLVKRVKYFDELTIATWRFSMPAMQQLHHWLDQGVIDKLNIVVDQRFARLSIDIHSYLKTFLFDYGGTLTVTKNHSKITLAKNIETNDHIVLESSANYNTNYRLEQTTIFNDQKLYQFHLETLNHVSGKSFAI